MEDIFWSGTPLLESVGEHEPFVEELRQTVRDSIIHSLIPLMAYAKEYEKYLELINLDINKFIKLVLIDISSSHFVILQLSVFIYVITTHPDVYLW